MRFSAWLKNVFKKPTTRAIEKSAPGEVLHTLKLGLALSGGGTYGAAYIGVFRAFEEAGLKFDYVAGTSAGSLFGAAYCSGLSAKQMEDIALNMRAKDVLSSKLIFVPNKTGKIESFVETILDGKSFEDLKTPFCAVAVDVISGEELHLRTGSLSKSIAGSCAYPGVFTSVEYPPFRLVDGGIMNNIPSDVVREMGADVVLAVDLNPSRGSGTDSTKYFDILKASLRIMSKANSYKGYVYADHLLKLDLSEYRQFKLEGLKEMIEIGYETALADMPNILKTLGMRVPNESIKETATRINEMQRKAKQIAKANKKRAKQEKSVKKETVEKQEEPNPLEELLAENMETEEKIGE